MKAHKILRGKPLGKWPSVDRKGGRRITKRLFGMYAVNVMALA
jgi:hypothetical protein